MVFLILINKDEAYWARKLFGSNVNIYRTSKQKSQRHRYYMSEEEYALQFINDYRANPQMALQKKRVITKLSIWY